MAVLSSRLTVKEWLHLNSPTFKQLHLHIRPFEGDHEADVAPAENVFDTPVIVFIEEIKH